MELAGGPAEMQRVRDGEDWRVRSYAELAADVRRLAARLVERGLAPGDRVRVQAYRDGSLWRAQDIQVLSDVRGDGYGDGGGYGMERRGAVSRVDPRSRTIYYTEGGYSGGEQYVTYDTRTVVEYRGQRYSPEALERGDLVRMTVSRADRGWVADRIMVEVSSRER